jgi:hypothetical protein
MSECQKISMSKGVGYPRTCPACGLAGGCKLGYPNWYVPKPGEPMKMPEELPKLDPSHPAPFNAQTEIAELRARIEALEAKTEKTFLLITPEHGAL